MMERCNRGPSPTSGLETNDEDGLPRDFPAGPCFPLQQVTRVMPLSRGASGLRVWRNFVATIESAGYAPEPVGRYARSLQQFPRRLWPLPFAQFLTEPLRSRQQRPWLGPKKQDLLNQIVQDLAVTLTGLHASSAIPPRIRTAGFAEVERQLWTAIVEPRLAGASQIQRSVFPWILDELERDAGVRTRQLFANRLLPSIPPITPTEHAGQLGITRARYYQLLQQGRAILRFRWPEGPAILSALADRVSQETGLGRREPFVEPELFVEQIAWHLFGD